MNENKSKMQPWQLILILILVGAVFAGLYIVNQAISARFDSVDTAIVSTTDAVKMAVDRVDGKVTAIKEQMSKAPVPAPVPVPAPAPAPEGAQPAAEPAK